MSSSAPVSKTFLYLRGQPGTGKITVARLLQQALGWKLFWFHDLKNAVYHIVQEHRIPRLMDAVTEPVVAHLLEKGESVIYVRPSPDKETVERIRSAVAACPGYRFVVVRLTASYDTLRARVSGRNDPYRISTQKELDAYVQARTVADIPGEYVLATDALSPREAADDILQYLHSESNAIR